MWGHWKKKKKKSVYKIKKREMHFFFFIYLLTARIALSELSNDLLRSPVLQ